MDIVDPATYVEKEVVVSRKAPFDFKTGDAVDAVALAKSSLMVKDGRLTF